MSDTIIHHIKLSYDESDPRVLYFVKHLRRTEGALLEYYEKCLKEKDGKIYISDEEGNEFTLICNPGHNCLLTLRGMENI